MINEDGLYLNAMGEILKISKTSYGEFLDESGNEYNQNGRFGDFSSESDDIDCKFDLIGFVPKELHCHILKVIKTYHTNSDAKRFVDKVYKENTNETN